MGGEFGQRREWAHEGALEWWVLQHGLHSGMMRWVADLNALYRADPAMHALDFEASGFEWVDADNSEASVIAYLRRDRDGRAILVVCNFTPVVRTNYAVGVPQGGFWRERLNSDAPVYGGSGQGNFGGVTAAPVPVHGRPYSLWLTLPPLSCVVLEPAAADAAPSS
jgi:1,4-alpha-glucan branching enzyme